MPVLEPGRTADAAAAARVNNPKEADDISAGVTATVIAGGIADYKHNPVAISSKGGVHSAATGRDSICRSLPASVELHPCVHRGRKKLATKIKQKLAAQAKLSVCSIQ